MRRVVVALAIVVILVPAWTPTASAGTATPVASPASQACEQISQEVGEAERDYEAIHPGMGTIALDFLVVEYDSSALAREEFAIVDRCFSTIMGVDITDLARQSLPQFGDESAGWNGIVPCEGFALEFSAIVVRSGRFVYLDIGVALVITPMLDLIDVAQRQFGRATLDTSTATPGATDLASLLPTPSDLPPGFKESPPETATPTDATPEAC